MTEGTAGVRWAPRLSKQKLRRLYESDATGVLDEALLDDVGVSLWLRCGSILEVADAKDGRIRCQACDGCGRETIIERPAMRRENQQAWTILCPACGWTVPWKEYERSFKKRQLNSGGATATFDRFAKAYPALRGPKEKLLGIDRLIHEFHFSLRSAPGVPTRSVGPNLIDGKLSDLLPFLDALSCGAPEAAPAREAWKKDYAGYRNWVAAGFPMTPVAGRKQEDA